MNLSDMLEDVIPNILSVDIDGLSSDSRKVNQGDLFFAINGNTNKGSDFAKEAIKNGAVAIITDDDIDDVNVPCFKVDDIRQIVSLAASRFYAGQPENMVAVTGTNGKTSTATFAMQLFNAMGEKSSVMGTLGVMDKSGIIFPSNVTTPDAIEIHKVLQELKDRDYTSMAFEASSHGLDQYRLDNVKLKAAGFTNLTRDHLDYHKTMISYGNAKKRLFFDVLPKDGVAVINADSEFFDELKDCGRNLISYGKNGKALRLLSTQILPTGQLIKISAFGDTYDVVLSLAGEFQVMNALCAAGLVIGCGFDKDKVIASLSRLEAPAGRMELVGTLPNESQVYVDYAHTPDALENALQSLRPFTESKLHVLFGCGGDRDPGKRALMGEIAEKYADKVFITDDNPRTEDAESIRAQVLKGAPTKGQNAGNREDAIKYVINQLGAKDILLIAGKGHENYQEINGIKHQFDDKLQAQEVISKL